MFFRWSRSPPRRIEGRRGLQPTGEVFPPPRLSGWFQRPGASGVRSCRAREPLGQAQWHDVFIVAERRLNGSIVAPRRNGVCGIGNRGLKPTATIGCRSAAGTRGGRHAQNEVMGVVVVAEQPRPSRWSGRAIHPLIIGGTVI